MIGLLRTAPIRRHGGTLVPILLAAIVAVFGAYVYLELVTALLEYAG